MSVVFADASYWVALFIPGDRSHEAARRLADTLGPTKVVTTDEVLTEFLAFVSRFGETARREAAQQVRDLLSDPEVEVRAQSRDTFLTGLALYERRLDKGYSLQDCISFATMRELGLTEVLTHDRHFAQEGFTVLLRR